MHRFYSTLIANDSVPLWESNKSWTWAPDSFFWVKPADLFQVLTNKNYKERDLTTEPALWTAVLGSAKKLLVLTLIICFMPGWNTHWSRAPRDIRKLSRERSALHCWAACLLGCRNQSILPGLMAKDKYFPILVLLLCQCHPWKLYLPAVLANTARLYGSNQKTLEMKLPILHAYPCDTTQSSLANHTLETYRTGAIKSCEPTKCPLRAVLGRWWAPGKEAASSPFFPCTESTAGLRSRSPRGLSLIAPISKRLSPQTRKTEARAAPDSPTSSPVMKSR